MSDTFKCEQCGETFEKAWTDDEAEAESLKLFGAIEDSAIVCHDCWLAMGLGGND